MLYFGMTFQDTTQQTRKDGKKKRYLVRISQQLVCRNKINEELCES